MKSPLLLCSVLMLLLSCAARKDLSQTEETTVQQQQDDHWKNDLRRSIDYYAAQSARERSEKMAQLQLSWNRTEYMPPDSTGKQYPQATEQATVNRQTTQTVDKTEEAIHQYSRIEQQVASLDRKMDQWMEQNRQRKEDTDPPWWVKICIVTGVGTLTFLLVKLYILIKK